MSEKAPNVPTTEQVGQWLEHSQKLIREGAVIDHMGKLSISGAQFDELSAQAPSQPLSEGAHNEHQSAAHEQAEAMSAERLKEIIQDSMYVANPYIMGAGEVTYNKFGNNDPEIEKTLGHLQKITAMNRDGLVERGASEVVTVMPYNQYGVYGGGTIISLEHQRAVWPSGDNKGEPAYILKYDTLTGARKDGAKYVYEDHVGRPNNFNYAIALPESAAKELEAAMKADPNIARQLGDELVQNTEARETHSGFGSSPSMWDQHKPQYDMWNEANGGVDRMAFANQYDQPAEQAEIIEYNMSKTGEAKSSI
jgi:hypothetical protein